MEGRDVEMIKMKEKVELLEAKIEKMEVLEAKLVKMEVLEANLEKMESKLEEKNITLSLNCSEAKLNLDQNQTFVTTATSQGLICFSFKKQQ